MSFFRHADQMNEVPLCLIVRELYLLHKVGQQKASLQTPSLHYAAVIVRALRLLEISGL